VIHVLIVDDHPVVRTGLHAMLDSQDDVTVVGEAANGHEALLIVEKDTRADATIDVVLMDLQMPELDGVAATSQIRAMPDAPQVLVLTTFDTDTDILRAIEAGAIGYLLKDAPPTELFRAIRLAAAGQAVFDPAVATRVLNQMRTPNAQNLSPRETEIIGLIAQGLSNKQAAAQLFLSEATVKTHLVHIFEKLGVDSRTAAVATAVDRGLIRMR
jgi:DNA-binding NarL/FixJ family response regulator